MCASPLTVDSTTTGSRPSRRLPSGPGHGGRVPFPQRSRSRLWGANDQATTALAFAARRGEANATEDFVRATRGDVWRFVASLADVNSADDLTQETYIRALGSLERFAGRSHARVWLLAIARRVVVDHHRRRAARPPVADTDVQFVLDQRSWSTTARFDEEFALLELLEALTAHRREAFLLTQVVGFSYHEVAMMTSCPVGTVRSRVARARRDLVTALRRAHTPSVESTGRVA